ncbi:MAG TPA: acyl-CoA dehydrogenase family protein [Miltoncostaeaceae bacterium]|jgi:alkylation response protein AidB-like acyl-CoA dehydrogenase|nr:acyl-CoA dehydrogenase family protein [Miltoncostaeaceae bacterium]
MDFELHARTESGRRLVALAESLSSDFAAHAAEHDRDGSYPHEDVEALRESGYLAAPVPQELGGMGVESVHDLLVAAARLSRGQPSVAIGANMHWIPLVNMAQLWRAAALSGDERRAAAYSGAMARVVSEGIVIATAVSEPGQDLTRPSTTARRTGDGWTVNGRKIFCTMSPAATLLYAAVTFDDGEGERYGYAQIPADAPGVVVHDDWDALGMRSSGSNSVSFEDVRLPRAALGGGFPVGNAEDYMLRNLAAGGFHAASSAGIAEAAHRTAVDGLARRIAASGATPRTQNLAAENAMELSAIRAVLQRAGTLIDEHHLSRSAWDGGGDLVALFAEVQAAKTFINEAAVRVVDRALALSGGAGYMASHPLSRAYRDVRAGAFMHPLGATRAYELIGEVALGLEPSLH